MVLRALVFLLYLSQVQGLPAARALGIQPYRSTEAHLLRGQALLDKDRFEEASQEFSKAINSNPADAESLYQLGLALWKLGRPAEASVRFAKSLQLAPNHER